MKKIKISQFSNAPVFRIVLYLIGFIVCVVVIGEIIINFKKGENVVEPSEFVSSNNKIQGFAEVEAVYRAELIQSGILPVYNEVEDTNYIDIRKSEDIKPGEVVAVTECYHLYQYKEKIQNDIISLGNSSSSAVGVIDVNQEIERAKKILEKKQACRIFNQHDVSGDFVQVSKSFFSLGEIVGYLKQKEFEQYYLIKGLVKSYIDALMLKKGRKIKIEINGQLFSGEIRAVREQGDVYWAKVFPDNFKDLGVFSEKMVDVSIVARLRLTEGEWRQERGRTEATIIRDSGTKGGRT